MKRLSIAMSLVLSMAACSGGEHPGQHRQPKLGRPNRHTPCRA